MLSTKEAQLFEKTTLPKGMITVDWLGFRTFPWFATPIQKKILSFWVENVKHTVSDKLRSDEGRIGAIYEKFAAHETMLFFDFCGDGRHIGYLCQRKVLLTSVV